MYNIGSNCCHSVSDNSNSSLFVEKKIPKLVSTNKQKISFITFSLSNGSSKNDHSCHSTDDDHDRVVTTSNSAYGVVSASKRHDYELIDLQMQQMSTTGRLH